MDARPFAPILLALSLVAAPGCDDAKPPKTDSPPAGAKSAEQDPATDPSAEPTAPEARGGLALLDWLDPEAVALVYAKREAPIDPEAFTTAFAVPPKLARMLRDIPAVAEGLDAIRDPADPSPDTWFGSEAVASTSVVSSGTYVLLTLKRGRADVEGFLERASMRRTEIEGFAVFVPEGPFPWKVAFLSETVVAFIPVKEIGSGLSPLTAGRDMPASQAEKELKQVLEQDPSTVLEAVAAGPLLHLDLGQDLAQYAVRARPFERTGLEVEVQLAPLEDPTRAAASLQERDLSLETDALAALAEKVAFSVEGPLVVGRLQATATDAATLAEG